MSDPGGYLKAASYAGLLFSGLGAIAFAMFNASAELTDEPGGNDTHGDWPAVPDDLKSSFHSRGK